MARVIRGRAWVLGDNISTDHIISGKYKFAKINKLEDMLPYVFEEVIPEFYKKVQPGDVIVAGRGFGYGSSREHAPRLLKLAGVGAVLAKSFHRIFYRNSINIGLPVIIVQRIPEVTEQGDEIEVNLEIGVVRNVTKGVEERFQPPPQQLLEILEADGIVEYIKKMNRLPW